jgi:hypothetical protein
MVKVSHRTFSFNHKKPGFFLVFYGEKKQFLGVEEPLGKFQNLPFKGCEQRPNQSYVTVPFGTNPLFHTPFRFFLINGMSQENLPFPPGSTFSQMLSP